MGQICGDYYVTFCRDLPFFLGLQSFHALCCASSALSTPSDDMIKGKEGTPTVSLDADEVTQEMAARLTIALLGQILYMKGQVPLCVFS